MITRNIAKTIDQTCSKDMSCCLPYKQGLFAFNSSSNHLNQKELKYYHKPPARNVLTTWSAVTVFASIFPKRNLCKTHLQALRLSKQLGQISCLFDYNANKTAEIVPGTFTWFALDLKFMKQKMRWTCPCFSASKLNRYWLFSSLVVALTSNMQSCTQIVTSHMKSLYCTRANARVSLMAHAFISSSSFLRKKRTEKFKK